ncbi:hypothetical protein SCLARK_001780 [Spiroplasma clarkii]|uniref:hypothetical protein n=1 Tax=Spiroplasma clarkii TaxID=2139 RepID=UPI000B5688FB|nr:hypothetical protein [Spiroplasma clarkii]ARU92227.1 hypothetical protein SCLARK_001780 [Spiroplasma clarkii]
MKKILASLAATSLLIAVSNPVACSSAPAISRARPFRFQPNSEESLLELIHYQIDELDEAKEIHSVLTESYGEALNSWPSAIRLSADAQFYMQVTSKVSALIVKFSMFLDSEIGADFNFDQIKGISFMPKSADSQLIESSKAAINELEDLVKKILTILN